MKKPVHCIGVLKGCPMDARSTLDSNFFSFSCSFWGKVGTIIDWRPQLDNWRFLLFKILDPPPHWWAFECSFYFSGLTKDEIIAQCLMFFLAGYETAATSIAFLLYSLALNPEVQENLCEEIKDVAGDQVKCSQWTKQVKCSGTLSYEKLMIKTIASVVQYIQVFHDKEIWRISVRLTSWSSLWCTTNWARQESVGQEISEVLLRAPLYILDFVHF